MRRNLLARAVIQEILILFTILMKYTPPCMGYVRGEINKIHKSCYFNVTRLILGPNRFNRIYYSQVEIVHL